MIPVSQRFSPADKLYDTARQQLASGEVEAAVRTLEEATGRFPTFAKAWSELANILLHHLHDAENAIDYFKKSIETDPKIAEAYLGYAEALFALERYAEVNAILNQAMEVKGVKKDQAHYRLALLLESQGRFDEAIDKYREAILATFSQENINRSEEGINRCVLKKKYSR